MLYDVPKPTEALLITGGFTGRAPDSPYRVVVGGGAWSVPVLHRVQRFHIGANTVNIQVRAQSKQNVDVDVEASVVFSVQSDKPNITQAANRFLGVDRNQILSTAHDIFSGETRAIIGTLTVEEMISDRLKLASEVLHNAEVKMLTFGWQIDSFQINSISDPSGYINALSAPELARVEREKAVAEAQRDAEIAEEREKSARRKSQYERDTQIEVASNEKAVAQSRAEARNAEPLAQAEADKSVAEKKAELAMVQAKADQDTAAAQAELAVEQAHLAENNLVTEVIKPAEAEAKRRRIEAEAQAEATRITADALSAGDAIALDQQMVEQMPEIMRSIADSLATSNLTMIGEGQDLTKLLSQLARIAPELRKLARPNGDAAASAEQAAE